MRIGLTLQCVCKYSNLSSIALLLAAANAAEFQPDLVLHSL